MPRLQDVLFGEIALRNALIGQTELQAAYDILEDRLAKGNKRTLGQILVENHLVERKVAIKICKLVAKLIQKKQKQKKKQRRKHAEEQGERQERKKRARQRTEAVLTPVAKVRRARTQAILTPIAAAPTRRATPIVSSPKQKTKRKRSKSRRVAVTQVVLRPVAPLRTDRRGTVRQELTAAQFKGMRNERPRARRSRGSARYHSQPSHAPFFMLMAFMMVVVVGLFAYLVSGRETVLLERAEAPSHERDERPERPQAPSSSQDEPWVSPHGQDATPSGRERRAEQLFREVMNRRDVYSQIVGLRGLAFDYSDTPVARRALDEAERLAGVAQDRDLAVLNRALEDCEALLRDGNLGMALSRLQQVQSDLTADAALEQAAARQRLVEDSIAETRASYDTQIDAFLAADQHASADSLLTVAAQRFGKHERTWIQARRNETYADLRGSEIAERNERALNQERYLLTLLDSVQRRDFDAAVQCVSDNGVASALDRDALALMQQVEQLVLAGAGAGNHGPREIEFRSGQTVHGKFMGVDDGLIVLRVDGSTMKISPDDLSDDERYRLAIHDSFGNSSIYKLGMALITLYSGQLSAGLELLEGLANKGAEVEAFLARAQQLASYFPELLDNEPVVADNPTSNEGTNTRAHANEDPLAERLEELFDPEAIVAYADGVITLHYEFSGKESFGEDWRLEQGRARRDPMGWGLKIQRSGFVESEGRFSGDVAVEAKFFSNEMPEENTRFSLCFRNGNAYLFEASYGLQVNAFKRNTLKANGAFGGDARDLILVGDTMLMGLRSERGKVYSSLSGLDRSYLKLADPLEAAAVCVMWQEANVRLQSITISGQIDTDWAHDKLR